MKKLKLLFICLGNICRSPAAQGIMQALVDKKGLRENFFIDSAGIGNWHAGQLPDKRMRKCGARHGYDFNHRARQFRPNEDFNKFDYILVMDNQNYNDICAKAHDEAQKSKVKTLAHYLCHHPGQHDIPDPYYGNSSDFEYVIELLEDACTGLLEKLTAHA